MRAERKRLATAGQKRGPLPPDTRPARGKSKSELRARRAALLRAPWCDGPPTSRAPVDRAMALGTPSAPGSPAPTRRTPAYLAPLGAQGRLGACRGRAAMWPQSGSKAPACASTAVSPEARHHHHRPSAMEIALFAATGPATLLAAGGVLVCSSLPCDLRSHLRSGKGGFVAPDRRRQLRRGFLVGRSVGCAVASRVARLCGATPATRAASQRKHKHGTAGPRDSGLATTAELDQPT